MGRIAFADESGTDRKSQCYSIGVVTVEEKDRDDFEQQVKALLEMHKVVGEPKWTRVRDSRALINFALDSLQLVLDWPSATFDVIVVRKDFFRNWQGGIAQQEKAFYQTYTYLLKHIVEKVNDISEVLIDARSDGYAKRDEAMLTIGNRMLAKLANTGRLGKVTKTRSHDSPGIQIADILTGAINTAHAMQIQPMQLHHGKLLTLTRLAAQLGWDHLAYDTYPHPTFNIWHFPIEYRGPSRDPNPMGAADYVLREDLTPDTVKVARLR
jgi:hypothetical protein